MSANRGKAGKRALERVAKRLEGKVVAHVDLRTFETGIADRWTTDLRIVFADGTALAFTVDEVDDGSTYGITPVYVPRPRPRPR